MTRLTGSAVRRVEDPRILTGRGRYVDDLKFPGMLHAAFVRSPWAHARLTSVDVSAALEVEGVVAAFTEVPVEMRGVPLLGLKAPAFHPLATDVCRFVGDPVAIVLATSRAIAEDAAELVVLDAEPLEPIATIDDALDNVKPPVFEEAGTNVLQDETVAYGDVDAAFARADHVLTTTFTSQRQTHLPVEPRAAIAVPGDGGLTYHAAHQNPHVLRSSLAAYLGLPATKVVVRCDDIGGSFGQKAYVSREEVALAWAALQVDRPVKWIEDRVENLLAAGQARDERIHVEVAVTSEGDLLGVRGRFVLDQGSYQLTTLPPSIFPTIVRVLFPGPYRLANWSFRTQVVATNKATYSAFRGPWASETFVRERLLDMVAADLGMSPVDIRWRNLRSAEELTTGSPAGMSLHAVTAAETFARALELVGHVPEGAGVGFAVVLEPAPGPPEYSQALGAGASPRTAQRAFARLEHDGTLTVVTSQSPHGQGHQTTLAQLAADRMGLPLERVHVVHGDTRVTPFNGVGTGGSRAATLASGAVIGVAEEVAAQVRSLAAELLEASADDLELVDGRVQVRGTPGAGIDLATVARSGFVEANFDYAIPEGGWSQATHVCVVDVDRSTGLVQVLRYLVVGDCGELINPAIVDGQIAGGIVQGIGGVLHEWAAYDDEGQPRATTLLDYLTPGAMDLPHIEIHHLESPPQGPVDFRGVGEGGAIGAPAALANAISNAIGVQVTERYLPPSRVLELLGAI